MTTADGIEVERSPAPGRWEAFRHFLLDADHLSFANKYLPWRSAFGSLCMVAVAAVLCGLFVHFNARVLLAAVLVVLVVGTVWPWVSTRGLRATLSFAAARAREGEPVRVRLDVRNWLPLGAWGVRVRGGLSEDGDAEVSLAVVPGWKQTRFEWEFVPGCRGEYPLLPPRLTSGFPFGLWEASRPIASDTPLLVWPAVFAVSGVPESASNSRSREGVVPRNRTGDEAVWGDRFFPSEGGETHRRRLPDSLARLPATAAGGLAELLRLPAGLRWPSRPTPPRGRRTRRHALGSGSTSPEGSPSNSDKPGKGCCVSARPQDEGPVRGLTIALAGVAALGIEAALAQPSPSPVGLAAAAGLTAAAGMTLLLRGRRGGAAALVALVALCAADLVRTAIQYKPPLELTMFVFFRNVGLVLASLSARPVVLRCVGGLSTALVLGAACLVEGRAGEVPEGWGRVEAVVARLRAGYAHDRGATVPEGCDDPIGHFLLESRRGPDFLFAASAAALLRVLGYPTRVTCGYYARPDRYDSATGHTAVLEEDLHFWTEVWQPGDEWVIVEPTPGYLAPQPARPWWQRCVTALASAGAWSRSHPGLLALTAATSGLLFWRRRAVADRLATLLWQIRSAASPRQRVLATIALLERRARRAGLPRPAGRTARAWYGALRDSVPHDQREPLSRFVELADWASYGPEPFWQRQPRGDGDVGRSCRRAVERWDLRSLRRLARRRDVRKGSPFALLAAIAIAIGLSPLTTPTVRASGGRPDCVSTRCGGQPVFHCRPRRGACCVVSPSRGTARALPNSVYLLYGLVFVLTVGSHGRTPKLPPDSLLDAAVERWYSRSSRRQASNTTARRVCR